MRLLCRTRTRWAWTRCVVCTRWDDRNSPRREMTTIRWAFAEQLCFLLSAMTRPSRGGSSLMTAGSLEQLLSGKESTVSPSLWPQSFIFNWSLVRLLRERTWSGDELKPSSFIQKLLLLLLLMLLCLPFLLLLLFLLFNLIIIICETCFTEKTSFRCCRRRDWVHFF